MEQTVDVEMTRARGGAMLFELVRAMRPKEWIKNTFVFAAIAFSQQRLWTRLDAVLTVIAAFGLFCMVASAIYLLNDLVDMEKDRAHPKKRNRPLASGRLSPYVAAVTAIVLVTTALPLSIMLDMQYTPPGGSAMWFGYNYDFMTALLAYVLVQGVAYSYYFKHVVIMDVFTIAAGFMLRAVAGAMVLDIVITPWLLICTGLLALFLGLAKRRAELVLLENGAGAHRRILDEYSLPLIDQMMSIITATIIIAYALFTSTAETLPQKPFPMMMITVPFVIYAIFRYLYLIYKQNGGGSPADLVLNDVPLAASIVLWGVTTMTILAVFSS
ncbi:decaprenyl-phosphate phosphoribosyltransferase [Roseiflexus sp.]|uniref:decaprenyl-phosphate phosphoribosyltransferase n=1 Tax=Roseiflexus sp. TaxID=2562120 RepID=UPI00398AEB38